jgi:predicted DNA-binding transcriptional regulator YafY
MQTAPITRASEVTVNEAIIRVAAAHERSVRFNYAKTADAPIETRVLAPTEVAVSDDEARVVIGKDPFRDEQVRSFRIDRIKGTVQVLDA